MEGGFERVQGVKSVASDPGQKYDWMISVSHHLEMWQCNGGEPNQNLGILVKSIVICESRGTERRTKVVYHQLNLN